MRGFANSSFQITEDWVSSLDIIYCFNENLKRNGGKIRKPTKKSKKNFKPGNGDVRKRIDENIKFLHFQSTNIIFEQCLGSI